MNKIMNKQTIAALILTIFIFVTVSTITIVRCCKNINNEILDGNNHVTVVDSVPNDTASVDTLR